MPNWLRVILARLLAAAVTSVCGWLALKFNIIYDQESQAKMVDTLLVVIVPIMFALYGFVHKVIDRHVNPLDTARSRTADPVTAEGVTAAHAPAAK